MFRKLICYRVQAVHKLQAIYKLGMSSTLILVSIL